MNSIDIPWDCGPLLEADESVRGMLKVVEEKKSEDSGSFWCWDGRVSLSTFLTLKLMLTLHRTIHGKSYHF